MGTAFLNVFMDKVKCCCGSESELSLENVDVTPEKAGEQGVPDIVIEGDGFACVIENKILSAEGQDQTRRYAEDWEVTAERNGIASD